MGNRTMATIKCKCGKVTVSFPQEQPIFAGECGCVDCLGKLSCYACKGGPEIPADIASQDKCLIAYYHHDKMVVTGKDKLKFTSVREGSASTNCVASCCNTVMFIDNPFYHQGSGDIGSTDGSGMVMFFESMHQTGVPAEMQIRWWIKDVPEEKLAQMPQLPSFYNEVPGDFSTMQFPYGGDKGFAAFSEGAKTPALQREGQTFAELLAECGGTVEVEPYTCPECPP